MAEEKAEKIAPWRVAVFVAVGLLVVWGIIAGRGAIGSLHDDSATPTREGAQRFRGLKCPIDVPPDAPPIEVPIDVDGAESTGLVVRRAARARIARGTLVLAASGPGSGTVRLPDGREGVVRWSADACEPVTLRDAPPEPEPAPEPVEAPAVEPLTNVAEPGE